MNNERANLTELFQQTVDSLPDAYFMLDSDFNFIYLNDAARRVLPVQTDLLGKNIFEVAPELSQETREIYRQALRDQQPAKFTRYHPQTDRWYEVHVYPTPRSLAVYFPDITDRKKIELIAEHVREVFYIFDPKKMAITYMSPAFRELYGLAYEAGAFRNVVLDEDWPKIEALRESYKHGQPTQTEFRIRKPDGEIRWVLDRSFPVFDEQNRLLTIVGIAEDVTAERRYQERTQFMAEATKLLSSTLDFRETMNRLTRLAVPTMADWCAVYLPDEHGKLRIAAVSHVDSRKIALAYDVEERFPPNPQSQTGTYGVFRSGQAEYVREITEDMLRAALKGEHLETILKLGLKSVITVPLIAREKAIGVMTFISAESNRLYNPDDVVFAQDLANRAAIAAANARLYDAAKRRAMEERALREAAHAVAASFSVEDIIKVIAESALTATNADGSFVERLDAEHALITVVASAGSMAPPVGEQISFEGSVAQLVLERGRPMAHTFRDHTALAVPLIDAGEAIGALILLRETNAPAFTDEEAERAHTFGNLASLGFRKVHLLEASEQRREELEQVLESRARLMRGFSHDLKNPIGAADGHAALLEDQMLGPLTDAQLNSVKRIRTSLAYSVQLINDLVELARAEAGQLVIKQQPIDVREIAREMVEQYRPAAEQAGLSIGCVINQVDVVTSDADRVRQILGNLLSNAVKYTKSGGKLEVVTGLEDGTVHVDVVDTGIGIPADKLHVLFKEFERIDPTVKPGAGLGLAISQRLARALGGNLAVHTERGKGSRFRLSLPR